VLSRTPHRRLPSAVFRLRSLEVLKVDRNCLQTIPHELGQLPTLNRHRFARFVVDFVVQLVVRQIRNKSTARCTTTTKSSVA